jgi:hypothetical protein
VRPDERAQGWRAYLAEDEEDKPIVLIYCPQCAEREFGPFPLTVRRQRRSHRR